MEEQANPPPDTGENEAHVLCEYELLREENIRRINARLEELGVGTRDARIKVTHVNHCILLRFLVSIVSVSCRCLYGLCNF